MKEQVYYIYILKCQNNMYYTGYTNDIIRRYKEHEEGSAKSKFTRSFKPVCLARCWRICGNKGDALKIESFIKRKTKKEKINFVQNPELLQNYIKKELQLQSVIEVFKPSFS